MKHFRCLLLFYVGLFLCLGVATAQQSRYQAFHVHEDQVSPGMLTEYNEVVGQLMNGFKDHNIQGVDLLAVQLEDFRYMYLTPISGLEDIGFSQMGDLREKMGEDAFDEMLTKMNKCYDAHGDYVIMLDKELSYQPDGIDINPEGQYYRRLDYWYVTPANWNAFMDLVEEVKAYHEMKEVPHPYRIYQSGLGVMEAYVMVAWAAENPEDLAARMSENNKALAGDEWSDLLGKVLDHAEGFETVHGWIRTDLTYTSESAEGDE